MKNLFIMLVLILVSCGPAGNDPAVEETREIDLGDNNKIRTINHEGHEYILFTGIYAGSLCHSESCHCKTK